MKVFRKTAILSMALGLGLILSGCSSVTIKPKGGAIISNSPTMEKSYSFFLGGLIGEHTVNVTQFCDGSEPVQFQSQNTFVDKLLGGLTLGIYTPRTVKIWCQDNEDDSNEGGEA